MVYLIHWKKQRAMEHTAPTDSSTTAHQDQWIHITDEMIVDVGYSDKAHRGKNRCNLFGQLKRHFIKDEDYRIKHVGTHHKYKLEMTQSAYEKLLRRTDRLRDTAKPNVPCFLYVLHNPVFTYYGPNVFKIGFSSDPSRCKNDGASMLLEESTIVYQKEVPSKGYERKLHKLLAKYRLKSTREFFDCSLDMIKDVMDTL